MVDLSLDSDPDFTALYDLLGLEAPVTKFDAITGFDAVSDVIALSASGDSTAFDALTALDVLAAPLIDHQSDLKNIVDGLLDLDPPPCASLGRVSASRLMRSRNSAQISSLTTWTW